MGNKLRTIALVLTLMVGGLTALSLGRAHASACGAGTAMSRAACYYGPGGTKWTQPGSRDNLSCKRPPSVGGRIAC